MMQSFQTQNLLNAKQKSDEFLKISGQFRLGDLPTESQHPKTTHLSEWSQTDLTHALNVMRSVDCDALELTLTQAGEILKLAHDMRSTLLSGHRVFFIGCGATGRLSLSLEVLWRESLAEQHPWSDQVRSLMAGGDVALIRSIENFEDHPEFGARMLDESGFQDGDLLVASTEGGETPYVIGAAQHAPEISKKNHWFLFCNPAELLIKKLERSRDALLNPRLNKMNLTVGPMAISGSTRMQASTVLMLAAGTALFESLKSHPSLESIEESIENLFDHQKSIDVTTLAPLIAAESEAYRRGDSLIYETNEYGITVMTDTTERSPTFSLAPFENRQDVGASASLCYLCVPSAHSFQEAWKHLLKREPRPLVGWSDYDAIGGPGRLAGYDFSSSLPAWRNSARPHVEHKTFKIFRKNQNQYFILQFENNEATFPRNNLTLLNEHLSLKMLLNMHSTLVMGRLGRYHGNVMTCVRPSNFKLIDRTIRYVQFLLGRENIQKFTYEDICFQCFVELETAEINEPIVLKVFDSFKQRVSQNHSRGGFSSGTGSSGAFEARSTSID